MAYADFDFYTGTYAGNAVRAEDFPRLSERSSEIIDDFTYHRIDENTIEKYNMPVKKACCAVCDYLNNIEIVNDTLRNPEKHIVTSETAGNISKTYANPLSTVSDENIRNAEIYNIISRYLACTGLMNRNVNAYFRR